MVVPNIKNWMNEKQILITGATGFIGKVLVEKLLFDCSDIKLIYILLRDKKGVNFQTRLDQYKNHDIFKRIQELNPLLLNKIQAVCGDITLPNLGLTEDDRNKLIDNVNVIFHCAASVRFDEPLKNAIVLNTKGTMEILTMAEKMKHLNAFIYTSTAYCNTDKKFIREIVYNPIFDYKTVLDACDRNDTELIQNIERDMLKILPNTYVFSKNLAEKIVDDFKEKIPVAIIRPSIVCPSYKEPYPGWVDSLNGPIGVLVGASTGILRTVHGSQMITPDLVPVDFTTNATIAAAVNLGNNNNNTCQIYNCTTSTDMPITWNEFLNLGREIYQDYPSTKILWYPGGKMHENYLMHCFYFFLTQLIPAIIYDLFRLIMKRKPWLIQLQRKIFSSLNIIDYFLNKEWKWENQNLRLLYDQLSIADKYTFNFDIYKVDYKDYILKWIVGSRRFIMKLDDSTIPAAKRKLKILYWIDFIVKFLFYFIIFLLFLSYFGHKKPLGSNVGCTQCQKFQLKF